MRTKQYIKKIKTMGFTMLSLTALLMCLYMVFSVTYPVTINDSQGYEQIVLERTATAEEVFSRWTKRVGNHLYQIAVV